MFPLSRSPVVVDAGSFVTEDDAPGSPGSWFARLLSMVAVTFAHQQLVLVGEASHLARLRTGCPGLLEGMLLAPFARPSLAAQAVARALQGRRPPVALVSQRQWGAPYVWSPGDAPRGAPRVAHVRLAAAWPCDRLQPTVEVTHRALPRTGERVCNPFGILRCDIPGRDRRDDGSVLAQVCIPELLGGWEARILSLLPAVVSLSLAEKLLLVMAIDELGPRAEQLASIFELERRELAEMRRSGPGERGVRKEQVH